MAVSSPYAVFRAADLSWPQLTPRPALKAVRLPLNPPLQTPRRRPRKRSYGSASRQSSWSVPIQGELFEASC